MIRREVWYAGWQASKDGGHATPPTQVIDVMQATGMRCKYGIAKKSWRETMDKVTAVHQSTKIEIRCAGLQVSLNIALVTASPREEKPMVRR